MESFKDAVVTITVPVITLDHTLFTTTEIERLDILKIDAEGHDWTILQQLNTETYHPRLIRLEVAHLNDDTIEYIHQWLRERGYSIDRNHGNPANPDFLSSLHIDRKDI